MIRRADTPDPASPRDLRAPQRAQTSCRDLARCRQAASLEMGGCPPRAEWPRRVLQEACGMQLQRRSCDQRDVECQPALIDEEPQAHLADARLRCGAADAESAGS